MFRSLSFRVWNIIIGWAVFFAAFSVYILTIEPTASYWDCGEFILTAHKLEVGHSPGAPLFMMLGHIFSLLAGGNVSRVALMINAFSALCSAFTILFLFWTITHFARKMVPVSVEYSPVERIMIWGSGVVGALAYTFSDTFWFSAVEGEVYALSSLFTAVVFWAVLQWEHEAGARYANRWLMLIAYLTGLSIGVHLLNLLAIPAIVWVYYFKRYTFSLKGFLLASIVAVTLLGGVLYVIIPGVLQFAVWFELFFVNVFGLPFHAGVLIYAVLLVGGLLAGMIYSYRFYKPLMHQIFLGISLVILGYASYAAIVIRSSANPPMDQTNPQDIFQLQDYLNRSQYGDRPLVKGAYYNAPMVNVERGKAVFFKGPNRYELRGYYQTPVYDARFFTLFPRMYSREPSHAEVYRWWNSSEGIPIQVKDASGKSVVLYKPSFRENLKFLFGYQLGHMYWRYFLWNFVGRQNDFQGYGGILNGNWISGIPLVDESLVGPLDKPDSLKNRGYNRYFFLPFLLGLAGLFCQYRKAKKDMWVVMLLFVLTGIAIVIYLNQTPNQPRERDYAFAGSFYAFAIWIGLGVMALIDGLPKKMKRLRPSVAVALVALIVVPCWMAVQNWDDHDRSGRYLARDMAVNYLNSCRKNAILFTYGDNDTFPLWYAQEVEGVRTDVRVVNLSYLTADWYVDQMALRAYESAPLPLPVNYQQFLPRNFVALVDALVRNTEGRPVHFAMTVPSRFYRAYITHLQQEGLSFFYAADPVMPDSDDSSQLQIAMNVDQMYGQLVGNAFWGNVQQSKVYVDENGRHLLQIFRGAYVRLAMELAVGGRADSAVKVLDCVEKVLPWRKVGITQSSQLTSSCVSPVVAYFMAGAVDKGNALAEDLYRALWLEQKYYWSFPVSMSGSVTQQLKDRAQTLKTLREIAKMNGQTGLLARFDALEKM